MTKAAIKISTSTAAQSKQQSHDSVLVGGAADFLASSWPISARWASTLSLMSSRLRGTLRVMTQSPLMGQKGENISPTVYIL